MGAGRPREYTAEELKKDLDEYIKNESNPTVAKFCLSKYMSKETIYRYAKESQELSNSIKCLHLKQESRTIDLMEQGELAPAWAIFKMKQKCYGWTDKQEIVSENTNKNVNLEVDSIEEADRIISEYNKK